MGMIRETATGRTYALEPEHVFGRIGPPRCSQKLGDPLVSCVHAVLRWTGRDWELRDLNSTNGTYLEGRRLAEASSRPVAVGARIGFGQPADQWEFIDGGYPEAMAVPLDGGDPVALDGEIHQAQARLGGMCPRARRQRTREALRRGDVPGRRPAMAVLLLRDGAADDRASGPRAGARRIRRAGSFLRGLAG